MLVLGGGRRGLRADFRSGYARGERESNDLRSSRRRSLAPTRHFSVMLFEARNVGGVSKVQIVKGTGPQHTLASLSAACCPDIDEV